MPKPLDLRILLVQAGGTDWDRDGRLLGAADLPLRSDELERLEAAFIGLPGRVGERTPASILSGPSEGCKQTADLVASALGSVRTKPLAGLRDLDLGLWEGTCGEDLEGRCPSIFKQWSEDPGSVTAPKGEELASAETRILESIAKAADKTKDEHPTLGVVLRGIAYGAFRCWAEAMPTSRIWNVLQDGPNEPRMMVIDRARFDAAGVSG